MFNREMALQTISDLTKEVLGFRLRKAWHEMNDTQLEREYNHYLTMSEKAVELENQRRNDAKSAHDDDISRIMQDFNVDYSTAIKWDMESYDTDDMDYYLYLKGM